MKLTLCNETVNFHNKTQSKVLRANTTSRLSDHVVGNSPSVSVTSVVVARKIKAVSDPLTQQFAQLGLVMRDSKNEQSSRRHDGTISLKVASSISGRGSRSEKHFLN